MAYIDVIVGSVEFWFIISTVRFNCNMTQYNKQLDSVQHRPHFKLFFNYTLWNKLQWNWNRNANIFIHINLFETVVCKMATIMFRPHFCYILSGFSKHLPNLLLTGSVWQPVLRSTICKELCNLQECCMKYVITAHITRQRNLIIHQIEPILVATL